MADGDREGRAPVDPALEAVAPPYGAYRGSYGNYERAQGNALGAGRLGGWSYATQGGFFDVQHPSESELAQEHNSAPTEPRRWDEIVLEELRSAA